MTTQEQTVPTFKDPIDWYSNLDVYSKYYFKDENKVTAELDAKLDFVEYLQARAYFSRNMLRNFLKQKSRVVMFGAGGTASWFLPKLLKIYNDAFTKCPEDAYELEIVIIDGDEV